MIRPNKTSESRSIGSSRPLERWVVCSDMGKSGLPISSPTVREGARVPSKSRNSSSRGRTFADARATDLSLGPVQ